MDPREIADMSPVKLALMVQRLRARAGGNDLIQAEPLAVIGMACRFPGASDLDAFWRLLREGGDAITEVPADRWSLDNYYDPAPDAPGKMSTRWGGFLAGIDGLDAAFFNISPREAASLDPQQRLLLEVAWEALEHAGCPAGELAGSRAGVFVGIATNDYGEIHKHPARIDPYFGTGNTRSIAVGRLSYVLDLHGPAIAVDTACSSSLVAVHLACQSLRAGESDLALAGGVSLILSPEGTIYFSKLGVMAADGRCKTFDARADGYVRGEGCGMVVLRRLSDALARGDRILALVRGTAVNQDGRSNGLTAPNGPAQEAVIRRALASGGVAPAQVSYVEAHGTGTPLGDPIEVGALARVLASGRPEGDRCWLGAVKTNLGHLEAAAGVAGLIKTVLALRHREIPPHLHFREPNPHVPWGELPLDVPTSAVPWRALGGRRIAGVSSFGFSGTNAHVVLEESPDEAGEETVSEEGSAAGSRYVIPLSARDPEAWRARARSLRDWMSRPVGGPAPSLASLAYTAARRRSHHEHRLGIVAADAGELVDRLDTFLDGREAPGVASGSVIAGEEPRLVFVFPGQGSQWLGMGRELRDGEPVFRDALDRCAEALGRHTSWSLTAEIAAGRERFEAWPVDVIQPVLFALQVALCELWRSWGVVPDAVVGHSLGEVAAAHVAGALSLEDAALVIARRSRIVKRAGGEGAMALVDLSAEEACLALAGDRERLGVAAVNGPRTVLLSGEPAALDALLAALEEHGVFCRRVQVDYASHSPQMDPLLPELRQALAEVVPRRTTIPFLSTVTGRLCSGLELDAGYWARNLREPVLFWPAVRSLAEDGHGLFVEVSPHPILAPALSQGLRELGRDGSVLPSMRRQEGEREVLLGSLAALHTAGRPVDWVPLTPGGRLIDLPPYPWQRRRFWLERPPAETPSTAATAGGHPLPGRRTDLAHPAGAVLWAGTLGEDLQPYLADHRIHGAVAVPGALYLAMALAGAEDLFGPGAEVAGLELHRLLFLTAAERRNVQAVAEAASGEAGREERAWLLHSEAGGWSLHATARLRRAAERPAEACGELSEIRRLCPAEVSGPAYYDQARDTGVELGPGFRVLERLWLGQGEALAEVRLPTGPGGGSACHPALLDGCLQTLAVAALLGNGETRDPYVPVRIASARILTRPGSHLWCHAWLGQSLDGGGFEGDAVLLDEAGVPVVELRGLRFARLDGTAQPLESWLYETVWRRVSPLAGNGIPARGSWMILADRSGVGAALAARLEAAGSPCVLAGPAEEMDLDGPAGLRAWLADLELRGLPPCSGIVHLRSLDAEPETLHGALPEDLAATSALHLLQALPERSGWTSGARLWLVTRGAQPVGAPVSAGGAFQALLWGLGRTAALERPDLRCALIDLPPDGSPEEMAALVLAELAAGGEGSVERQIALRGTDRYAPRLARSSPELRRAVSGRRPARLRADASYLLTGGWGGLGLEVARFMVRQGARHLALLGRRSGGSRARQALSELAAEGAAVELLPADVTCGDQLMAALARIDATLPPLRGVVHAAGALDDAPLAELDRGRLLAVLAPKVAGAWNLHRLLAGRDLDFFVLFSSTAALFAGPAQGNYAAANAFVDALAHHRASLGLPALSIGWGAWSGVGLAATEARGGRLAVQGVGSLTPDQGCEALGRLLAGAPPCVAVLPLDVERWSQAYPEVREQPFFAELLGGTDRADAAPASTRERLQRAAGTAERRALLAAELGRQIGAVVGLAPEQIDSRGALGSLGIDSLMALQLRNRLEGELGLELSATLLWRFPTIAALASHLVDRLEGSWGAPPPSTVPGTAPAAEAQVPVEQLAAMLAAELARLDAGGMK